MNDSQGHQAGDKALKLLAVVLREYTRQSDTIARPGGDEFAILMPNTHEKDCSSVCQLLCAAIAQRMSEAGFAITSSIGSATFEQVVKELSVILERADRAMCIAKQTGNCYVQVISDFAY